MICDVLILQKGKIGGICEFMNHMRRDLPPEVYVIDEMFFFQFLKTSIFPLNLIHKKRYLKFSLLNLCPLKFCLKYLHDV